jgi:hypothetical protein
MDVLSVFEILPYVSKGNTFAVPPFIKEALMKVTLKESFKEMDLVSWWVDNLVPVVADKF